MNERYMFTMPRDQAIKDAVETIEKAFKIGRAELLQALDAQCVKHGRWIPKAGEFWWLCSNCKNNIIYSTSDRDRTEKQRYCSKCGARMDLKDGDTK